MKRILVITGILPIPAIKKKKDENDILLVTEDNLKQRYNDITFHYLLSLPKTNRLLSLLSSKWNSYYKLQKQKKYPVRGRMVDVVGIIMLPKKLKIRNLLYDLSFWQKRKQIESIIEAFSPTMIHAQAVDGNAYLAKKIGKKYKIPYIVTLRGVNEKPDRLIFDNLNNAKAIIALSPIKKNIVEPFIGKKIKFIPHGTTEDFFCSENKKEIILPIKFVIVCRLLALKNIDKTIRAFSLVKDNYILDIYGDGPEKGNLQMLITELALGDKIKLNGFINNAELPQKLKQYDIFIMLSYPESLGRVYFEAMACGLPVIASKGTGVDGIIVDGLHGFLVNYKDINRLYEVIVTLFKNPKKILELRENALKLVENFRWDAISKLLYEVYE